jgi:hypothetical protein
MFDSHNTSPRSVLGWIGSGALLLGIGACGGSNAKPTSTFPLGSVQLNPATGLQFVVDNNVGGDASAMHVRVLYWGRLVNIYSRDVGTGVDTLLFKDYLIGQDIESDGAHYELTRNPVTGQENLVILHNFGTPEFTLAFNALETGLQPFLDKSLAATELPPYTAIPRNAAMVIALDDLLDDGGNPSDSAYPGSVAGETVKIDIGYPPTTQFEPRVLPDPNHGDIVGGVFHSTRVIVDMTVSQSEATGAGVPVNGIGLPQAVNTAQPNVALRLPSKISAAGQQFHVLTNLSGHPVAFTGNGSTDPFSSSLDVVRAFRSGGPTSVTGDLFNGFLLDDTKPQVIGAQSVTVTNILPTGSEFLVDFTFASLVCSVRPLKGNILQLGAVVAEVTQDGAPPSAGVASNVHMRLVSGPGALFVPGGGEFRMAWNLSLGAAPECFLTFEPAPGTAPDTNVSNQATVSVRFSEPIDPDSMRAFETFTLSYGTNIPTSPIKRQVTGAIAAATDLTEFTFTPALPLKHSAAVADNYKVDLNSSAVGITDLAGNPMADPLTTAGGASPDFTLTSTLPVIDSGSIGLKFSAPDEDGNSSPEWRGQLIYDLAHGLVRPRSMTRYSAIVDQNEPVVAIMPGGLASLRIPLTRYGCRLQTVWRYHDMGLRILDDATHNLDIEGLNWAPASGGLQIDNFNEFEMSIAHSKFLPDEVLTLTGAVAFPDSGLSDTFNDNFLDPGTTAQPGTDPVTIVHPRALGYTVQPLDEFTSNSGTRMAPWPMNQGLSVSQFVYWTWRDTGKTKVAGPNGQGADYGNVFTVDPTAAAVYGANAVPTIGLPLLMEFRTYPNPLANGGNLFAGALATPVLLPENQPFFTAYSAGGVAGTVITDINPDGEVTAQGTNPPGGPGNLPRNQFVYFGQADFVVRVNRAHSIWFDTGALNSFGSPVMEPPLSSLPPGTQLLLAYRGASGITGPVSRPWENASNMDPYGNPSPLLAGGSTWTVTFLNSDNSWHSTMQDLAGSQYFQVRITMVSNAESGVSPALSSLGFGFYH